MRDDAWGPGHPCAVSHERGYAECEHDAARGRVLKATWLEKLAVAHAVLYPFSTRGS